MARKHHKKKRSASQIAVAIVVIHESPRDEHCHVIPGPARVNLGDHVRWFNETSASITVTFPHDSLDTDKGFQVKIAKGKSHQTGKATRKGAFDYQIFCEETGNNATGSDPEIIIV